MNGADYLVNTILGWYRFRVRNYTVLLTAPFKRLPSALRSLDRLILYRSSPPRVLWPGLEHRLVLTVRWDQRAKIS